VQFEVPKDRLCNKHSADDYKSIMVQKYGGSHSILSNMCRFGQYDSNAWKKFYFVASKGP
jgi:hypothetical protein